MPPHSRLGFAQAEDFARTRDLLTSAGYTDKAMLELVDIPASSLPHDGGAALALASADKGSPLETLIHLFLVGAPVDARAVRRALQPMALEPWAEGGLLTLEGDKVRAQVRILPFRGFWLAHDLPQRRQREDYVMGVGTSTLRLLEVAIRRPIRAMLDLGSGCGTHALFAARHAAKVIATDLNPRAVLFARFNFALNGASSVEALGGSLFEPVAGRKFDLVLSNPPFVISPDSRYIYRDGGLPGDAFCERLVREAPAVLEEGGYCQILCSWAHVRGEDWRDRLTRWFRDCGCDAWVMRTETEEGAAYAYTWIRQTEAEEPVRMGELHRRWMESYRQQGIERVSTGVITMRKASGRSNWLRLDDSPPRILGPCGDDIELVFTLRDFLETARDDARLLKARLRVSPVAELRQKLTPSEGAWIAEDMDLSREQGLGAVARVDAYVAGLVGRCDGRRTLDELIEELAAALGRSREEVAPPMLLIVRQLIERAILLPEGIFG